MWQPYGHRPGIDVPGTNVPIAAAYDIANRQPGFTAPTNFEAERLQRESDKAAFQEAVRTAKSVQDLPVLRFANDSVGAKAICGALCRILSATAQPNLQERAVTLEGRRRFMVDTYNWRVVSNDDVGHRLWRIPLVSSYKHSEQAIDAEGYLFEFNKTVVLTVNVPPPRKVKRFEERRRVITSLSSPNVGVGGHGGMGAPLSNCFGSSPVNNLELAIAHWDRTAMVALYPGHAM